MVDKRVIPDDARINLEALWVALVEHHPMSLEMLCETVAGFGVRRILRCESSTETQKTLAHRAVDLVIADAHMPDVDGFDLVRWLRRESADPNRTVPVFLMVGHTRLRDVLRARDCGANTVIAKPMVPAILLERILRVARDERMFIRTDSYAGPDRRVRRLGPPPGTRGRRAEDSEGPLGAATGPNLDQDAIDAFLKPMRATI